MSLGKKPKGTWKGVGNNYLGNLNATNTWDKKLKSKRGHYRVGFVREFQGLSERDLDLKLSYAKDLVSSYIGVPVDFLVLERKKETITLSSVDSVYYVKTGKQVKGKISIRSQRTFSSLGLIFVYMERNIVEPGRKMKKGTRGEKARRYRKGNYHKINQKSTL